MESGLAAKIDEAIHRIDQTFLDDSVARLLIVPAYHIHAIWCVNDRTGLQRVFVVDAPMSRRIRAGDDYSSKDFLIALRRERPIAGILGRSPRSLAGAKRPGGRFARRKRATPVGTSTWT